MSDTAAPHGAPARRAYRHRWLLVPLCLAAGAPAAAFDHDAFLALDRAALRAAEARLSDLDEDGLRKLLAAPTGREVQYLLHRHRTLHAEMSRPPLQSRLPDGSVWIDHPQASTLFSRIVADADGQPVLECGGYHDALAAQLAKAGFDLAADRESGTASATPVPAATAAMSKAIGPVLTAVYVDSPGFGFNDPRPVAPAPGNPETTLGGQRKRALQAALDIWATRLDSDVPIRVQASFEDLGCGEGNFAGFGGPQGVYANFPGAPLADINYPAALAAALAGQRLSVATPEIRIRLNNRIDEEACFDSIPAGYWYGLSLDAPPAVETFSFLGLVVHEIAHGLGFLTLANQSTGNFGGNPPRPDIYSTFLYSVSLQRTWPQMSAAQRRDSATNEPDLVWSGPRVQSAATAFLRPPGEIRVQPAVAGATRFPAYVQGFSAPELDPAGLTAPFSVADNDIDDPPDPARARTDACQPLQNQATGQVVLATRGTCFFSVKWQHAADAGAAALLVADNVAESEAGNIARNRALALSNRLPIPIWSVSQEVGTALLAQPPADITLGFDETLPLLGTNAGRVVMEGSSDSSASNVSHFSRSLFPASVMASSSAGGHVSLPDLVTDLFRDLGWPDGAAKRAQYTGSWYDPARSGEGCQLNLEGDENTFILACFMYLDGEQVWVTDATTLDGDVLDFLNVTITRGTGYGTAFDPADVERIPWGRIQLRATDCNRLYASFLPRLAPYREFAIPMTRVIPGNCQTPVSGQPDRRFSGAFYDQSRSGEGIQITQEADGETLALTWYTYFEGEQFWATGAARREGERAVFDSVITTRGGDYGPGLDPDAVQRIPFGAITVDRIDCRRMRVRIDPVLPGFEASDRELVQLLPRAC